MSAREPYTAGNVVVLDTITVRWKRLCRAVTAAQIARTPENVAAVHEAREAYIDAWDRQRRRPAWRPNGDAA